MEMLNRAIEDAADFKELLKKLDAPFVGQSVDLNSRKERRARERAEKKAALRERRKVAA